MTFMDSVMMIFKTDSTGTYNGFEIQYAIQSKNTNNHHKYVQLIF